MQKKLSIQPKVKNIWFVANTFDKSLFSTKTVKTLSDFKKLTYKITSGVSETVIANGGNKYLRMAGEVADIPTGSEITVTLHRLVAKVTVIYKSFEETARRLEINSIQVKNVSTFQHYAANKDETTESIINSHVATPIYSTPADNKIEGSYVFYIPQNIGGVKNEITSMKDKNNHTIEGKYTNIEIMGSYFNNGVKKRAVTIKTYLGNNYNDFNININKHYTVDVTIYPCAYDALESDSRVTVSELSIPLDNLLVHYEFGTGLGPNSSFVKAKEIKNLANLNSPKPLIFDEGRPKVPAISANIIQDVNFAKFDKAYINTYALNDYKIGEKAFTIVFVGKIRDVGVIYGPSHSGANSRWYVYYAGSGSEIQVGYAANAQKPIPNYNYTTGSPISIVDRNEPYTDGTGTTRTVTVNNNQAVTLDLSSYNLPSQIYVGTHVNPGGHYIYDYDISLFLIYDKALSVKERRQLHAYILEKGYL